MSTKIFPHRPLNPMKNVLPTAQSLAPPAPVVDIVAQRQAMEIARLQRKGQRALDRAVQRKLAEAEDKTTNGPGPRYQPVAGAPNGHERFFNVDILLVGTLMTEWKEKRISQSTLMRTIRPVDLWDIDLQNCVACGKRLGVVRWPALLYIARPKPPSKKRPLDPVCVCEGCFLEDARGGDSRGLAESAMLAYTKLAEPTAGIEMSQEDLDTWAARIDLYAIRSKRRVTQYEDEPAYAQFNHIMIPR